MKVWRMVVGLIAAVLVSAGAVQPRAADDLSRILARVGDRVAQYYANAQSVVTQETMRFQPETRDLAPDGRPRVLVYDVHLEWTPPGDGHDAQANIVRQLLKVNGRTPRPDGKDPDEEKCLDPEPISPEPLTMLLPEHRGDYTFTLAGHGKQDGHPSVLVDYKERVVGKPSVKWKDECVSVDLPGRFRGRLWLDESTDDVLRLDEELVGRFSLDVPREHQSPVSHESMMTLEQASVSTRYQIVTFHDPEETLIVPRSVETTDAWSGAGHPRMRVTQTFSNYRRFVGESHLVDNANP